jgi:aminoglycoside phosphotransferase (APT) family kinase protein
LNSWEDRLTADGAAAAARGSGSAPVSAPISGRDQSVTAPTLVAPEVRDLDDLARQLAAWLKTRMPEADGIELRNLSYPLGAGMSHETILFDAAWREAGRTVERGMVVRIKPMRRQVYQDDMFDAQYQLMQLMHRLDVVPVAEPLWFEQDPSLLGAPFFVMAKVSGSVAVSFPPYSKQGWLFDAAPADRRRLWEDSVRALARIQTVPISEAPFLHLPGEFAENFDQEIDRWTRYLDWADPERNCGLLRGAFERLKAARPKNRPEGIVWGDARLGNLMVSDDFKVVAVMDWEQPSLGGALQDLGWWLYTERLQTVLRGIPPLEGMGAREETLALWSETCGKSTADIEWYEAFAAFKMDCLSVRMLSVGTLPEAARQIEPGARTTAMLEELGIA